MPVYLDLSQLPANPMNGSTFIALSKTSWIYDNGAFPHGLYILNRPPRFCFQLQLLQEPHSIDFQLAIVVVNCANCTLSLG